ncbi:MAG: universal stress protein [Candidatus Nanohaloarchaea archaeon]
MYEKILLPTDGSEGAEKAFKHAKELADKYGAELHILYVADIRIESVSDFVSNISGALEEAGRETTEELEEKAADQGINAITVVRKGTPHSEINDYVQEEGIDMVVMGTHGRTGIDRMLLGSTTEKIVRTSEVPVLTVGRD